MGISAEDIAFARELFEGLGPLTYRRMMGGMCLYRDGIIFAIVTPEGAICLKGAGDMATRMTAEGWERWTPARDGHAPSAMPYWHLPDAALDDPEVACDLARDALARL